MKTQVFKWRGPVVALVHDGVTPEEEQRLTAAATEDETRREEEDDGILRPPTRDSEGFRSDTRMLTAQNKKNRKFWEDHDALN